MRRGGHGRGVAGDAHGRGPGDPHLAVGPGLAGGPLDGVVAVLDVVLIGRVEALRMAPAAHVLQHIDIAGVGIVARLGGSLLRRAADILEIGRAGDDHRPGAGSGGLEHIGGQLRPVAQSGELLGGAGGDGGRCGRARRWRLGMGGQGRQQQARSQQGLDLHGRSPLRRRAARNVVVFEMRGAFARGLDASPISPASGGRVRSTESNAAKARSAGRCARCRRSR